MQTIETATVQAEIWDYVDPNTEQSELPVLEKPEEPTVQSVKPSATNYKDLIDIEREELRDLKITFKRNTKNTRYWRQQYLLLPKEVDKRHH